MTHGARYTPLRLENPLAPARDPIGGTVTPTRRQPPGLRVRSLQKSRHESGPAAVAEGNVRTPGQLAAQSHWVSGGPARVGESP